MKTAEIKKLLESFYEGQTSHSEELLLLDYFSGSEVVEELEDERDIFLQLYQGELIDVPVSLETNINKLIDKLSEKDNKTKRSKRFVLWASIAASVAIIISAGLYLRTPAFKGDYSGIAESEFNNDDDNFADQEFTEVEFKEAENAMLLLAANFNKGLDQLNKLNEKLEETNDIVAEAFNKRN